MSDVVLRCPNCGTTQSAPGECEACHEAAVRYFCPNHTPGRWLDGPACAECAARAERERAAPRGPTPVPPPARPSTRPPVRPPPAPRRETPPPPADVRARTSEAEPPRRVRVTTLPREDELGLDELRARGVGRARRRMPALSLPRVGVRVAPGLGCLVRLVLLIVVAVLLFTVVPFVGMVLLGGSAREWAVDVGQQFGVVEGVPEQTRRGIAAFRAGDFVTAERELSEAARSYPRSGVALVYLARLRADAGDIDRAGEYLREAVAREPDYALAHRELADHYLTLSPGRPEHERAQLLRAEEHYVRALQLDPTDRRAHGYYACALFGLGRTEEAARERELAGTGAWDTCAGGGGGGVQPP